MVRVGFVLDDVHHLQTELLSKAVWKFIEDVDDFHDKNGSQLDILIIDHINCSLYLDNLLGKLYSAVRDVLISKGFNLLPINVLLDNFKKERIEWDYMYVPNLTSNYGITAKHIELIPNITSPVITTNDKMYKKIISTKNDKNKYNVSALGGTFDHIHDGHKILLTIAAFVTSDRLIVGLTEGELLVNKKYKEYLESFNTRLEHVSQFLDLLKPKVKLEIVPMKDVCGPTGTVPEIQSLIVSRETIKGGEFVNKTREEKGMPKLDILIVNVLGGEEDDGWKEKLSSTDIRKMIKENK